MRLGVPSRMPSAARAVEVHAPPLTRHNTLRARLRYDPQLDVDDSITTESERVAFLKTVSQLMASRARIKLNMRRLYAADGHAVKELLKIASVLYQATKRSTRDDSTGAAEFHLSTKAFDVKQSRHLASEITTRGAALFDMLEAEHELKDLRQKAINRNLDSSEVRTEGYCVRTPVSVCIRLLLGSCRRVVQLAVLGLTSTPLYTHRG